MIPGYDSLPIDSKYPKNTAWGLWGKDDSLGTLNLLTGEIVLQARKHIKTGKTFPLNWKLEEPNPGPLAREQINHSYKEFSKDHLILDDIYSNFNTQSSSQWDGLRHISHYETKMFYNNVSPAEVLLGNPESNKRLGIHHMARRGIVGRAVLLDYARWAAVHNPEFDPFSYTEVTVQELDKVAESQGVVFETGDILLIHFGWIQKYEDLGFSTENVACAGLKACEDTFRWIWNHHFSAVASDNFAVEAYPIVWSNSCHSVFIGGWGMPMGEMFDLKTLAKDSAQDLVYTCFFTSAPLNKENGIATPPNAICIK